MESISKALFAIDDFVWGTPMTVIVLMTGMILSIRFGFQRLDSGALIADLFFVG